MLVVELRPRLQRVSLAVGLACAFLTGCTGGPRAEYEWKQMREPDLGLDDARYTCKAEARAGTPRPRQRSESDGPLSRTRDQFERQDIQDRIFTACMANKGWRWAPIEQTQAREEPSE